MKQILLFTFLLLGSSRLIAQNFGIQAGASFYNVNYKPDDPTEDYDTKIRVGFTGGFVADWSLGSNISFRPELNFVQKGYKVKTSQAGFSIDGYEQYNYLELPLNVVYNTPAGRGSFFVGLGPVLSLGLSGKYKATVSGPGMPATTETDDIKFGSNKDKDHYKAFEFGADIIAGYKFSQGVFITAGYNLGLNDLSLDDSYSQKNMGFNVKVGYMFSRMMRKK